MRHEPDFTCTIGTLAPRGTATVTVTYTVPATTAAGVQTNSVVVSSPSPDPDTADRTTSDNTTVIALADVSVTKDDGDGDETDLDFAATTVVAGQDSITYSLSISNSGPSDALGVVVTDKLPAGVTFVSASAGCTYASLSHDVTCLIGTLAAGARSATRSPSASMPRPSV